MNTKKKTVKRTIGDLFEKCGITGLKVKAGILEAEWRPAIFDKDAAWDLYVELLTRITTQRLAPEHGTELAALSSIHKLFELTRTILKSKGRKAVKFTKIAIIVLNQVVRPFTAKWHRISEAEGFNDPDKCKEFREELEVVQSKLRKYTQLLSNIAGVEDMTNMENFNE